MRIAFCKRIGVVLFGLICVADATGASLPPVESFFNDAETQFAVISPNSKYIATIVKIAKQQALVVRSTEDATQFNVIAHDDDGKMFDATWVNNNRLLVRYFGEHHSEYRGNYDVYAIDRETGNSRILINGNWGYHQQITGSNIKDRTLSAEYNFFATTHDGSDDIIVKRMHYNDGAKEFDGSNLYRLNTKTGAIKDLVSGTIPPNTMGWLLDKHDNVRVAFSNAKGKCAVYVYEGADWTEMDKQDCFDRILRPVYFENDDTILTISQPNDFAALYRYHLKSRKYDDEPMLQMKGFDYTGVLEIDHQSDKIAGIHYKTDALASFWFDPQMAALQKSIDDRLKSTINTISCGDQCAGASAYLITTNSDRQPPQYVLYLPASDKFIGLGGKHPAINPKEMGMRDFYTYDARDGRKIPIYVTTPPGKLPKPFPTVVLIHGGPYMHDASWEWEAEAQFLATRGYLVLQPEFRGTMGYGENHYKSGFKQWGQTMQTDIADAAQWAIGKGMADPQRIGLMGGSYGGYATLMGLIDNPELFRCGVEFAGVTDLKLMFSSPVSDMSESAVAYSLPTILGDPVADADKLKDNSPVNHADKLTQPLLMAAGGIDRRVPIAHAIEFHDAVTSHNKQVEWIVYNEEGHGFYYEKDRLDFYQHVENFFDVNLKNAK